MGRMIERIAEDALRAREALTAERDALRAALRGLMRLLEDGTLVRDISHDHEPGWAMRQLPLTQALAAAHAALRPHPEET